MAKTLSLVGGRATAILRPAALHGHTGFARRTGSGRQSWTCEASSVVVRTGGAGLRRPADVAMMQATDFGNLHDPASSESSTDLASGASLSSER